MEQVIANGLYLGAQYALIALGLTLIFALMNVLNFAHGQMYVLGGFVTYEVYGLMQLPFVVALIASALTLAILGALDRALAVPNRDQAQRARGEHDAARGRRRLFSRRGDPAAVRREAARRPQDRERRLHLGQSHSAVGPHRRRRPRHSVHRRLHPDDAVHQARPRDARAGAGPRRGAADGRAGRSSIR